MAYIRRRDNPINSTAGQPHLCYNSLAAHSLPENCLGQLESQHVADRREAERAGVDTAFPCGTAHMCSSARGALTPTGYQAAGTALTVQLSQPEAPG